MTPFRDRLYPMRLYIILPDQETVLVNARVTVAGILSALPQEPHLPEASPTAPAPSGGSTSTTGLAPRSTISTRWRQRKPSRDRPSSNPR